VTAQGQENVNVIVLLHLVVVMGVLERVCNTNTVKLETAVSKHLKRIFVEEHFFVADVTSYDFKHQYSSAVQFEKDAFVNEK